jgi:hypothetical protein
VALIACGLWAFCCRGNDEDNSAIHEHHASPDDDASGVPPVSACANFSRNLSHVRRVFASIPCTTAIHSVTSSSCEVECQENSAGSCVHRLLIFHTVRNPWLPRTRALTTHTTRLSGARLPVATELGTESGTSAQLSSTQGANHEGSGHARPPRSDIAFYPNPRYGTGKPRSHRPPGASEI